jgi:DNA-binding FrmR family transcriptional regulator
MENAADLNKENHPAHTHDHIHHKHIHSQAEKKAVINRLSKAVGHIEAIKRMVENDADCSQVLIQLAAVRAAINNTGNLVLKNHISHGIVEAVQEGDDQTIEDLNNAIDRFIK